MSRCWKAKLLISTRIDLFRFRAGHAQEEVTKAQAEGCPNDRGHRDAKFLGHRDTWQNSQNKEENDKVSSAAVLSSALNGEKVIPAGAHCDS